MTLYIAIGFFQGLFDALLHEYTFKKQFLFKWPVKSRALAWIVYLGGTFLIFSLPFTWVLLIPGAPEWGLFYTPAWLLAVMAGAAICRLLLRPAR
jgi:hypothetical protein